MTISYQQQEQQEEYYDEGNQPYHEYGLSRDVVNDDCNNDVNKDHHQNSDDESRELNRDRHYKYYNDSGGNDDDDGDEEGHQELDGYRSQDVTTRINGTDSDKKCCCGPCRSSMSFWKYVWDEVW